MEDDGWSPVILEDVFYLYPSRSIRCALRLTEDKLSVRPAGEDDAKVVKYDTVSMHDVIGCHVMRGRTEGHFNHLEVYPSAGDPSAYLAIYSYPLTYRGTFLNKQQRRERYVLTFQILKNPDSKENLRVAHRWRVTILWLIRHNSLSDITRIPSVPPSPRNLLVFINPFGGTGKAYQIFRERVVSLLAESDIQHDLIITDRANHAHDFVRSADLNHWSGIVVVSGDGLLFEVFNGLMGREDWKTAIKIPVGVVPGGSGNGLAKAISYAIGEPYDTSNMISSTLNIVRGRISPMDLVHIQTSEKDMYSFLSIGWGIMADIDIESERLRYLGEARFIVWSLIRTLGLRKYRGRLSYLPVAGIQTHKATDFSEWRLERSKTVEENMHWSNQFSKENGDRLSNVPLERSKSFVSIDDPEVTIPEGYNNMPQLEKHSFTESEIWTENSNTGHNNQFGDTHDEIDFKIEGSFVTNTSMDKGVKDKGLQYIHKECTKTHNTNSCSSISSEYLPSLSEPLPDNWVVEEGEFVLVYVSLQTHLSSDVFIAPNAKLDDGIMWLLVIRDDVSRVQIINFFSCLQSGTHVDNPCVEMIPIKAFRLEPFSPDGFLTVDGEAVACRPLQAEVLPSIARIMTR